MRSLRARRSGLLRTTPASRSMALRAAAAIAWRWFSRHGVILYHGEYPLRARPLKERHASVEEAKRAAFAYHCNSAGWFFSITKNGREVWSSDHEIAAMNRPVQ